jgi:GT2 family glycosyltransferase
VAPALSVVVPSRDGRDWLAIALPPLTADLSGLAGEVIVVDDGSRDGTAAWLLDAFPDVRVVSPPGEGQAGFAAACNAGARAARAPVLAFLNNDAEVRPGWARALLAELAAHPEAVVVGGLSLRRDAPDLVDSAGIRLSPFGSASDIAIGRPAATVGPESREVAGVSGVNLAVRAAWFADTGGFDEQLFMYFEDVDLCLRAWFGGHTVRFTPAAVVLHAGSATAGIRYAPLRNYYGSRNRIIVAAKSHGRLGALGAIPALLAQDAATILWIGLTGHPRRAWRTARDRTRGARDGLRRAWPAMRHAPRGERTFAELRRAGLTAGWRSSAAEFARIRRRELRPRPPARP